MNKKHTIESVKKYFKEQDCELLEETYRNVDTAMRYICNCGNKSKITFSHFKNGVRCQKCRGNQKHILNDIKNYFAEDGCELLEKEYKNALTSMKYRCSCGNISKIAFSNFQRGVRCKKCGLEKTSGINNGNYNPNLTDYDREDRRLIEGYREWVKDVYKKDSYTCQKCSQKGGKLNAHHIEGYAENKDLRMDIDNGITFCQKCHNKLHAIYGKYDISKEHLDGFLKTSNN